MCGFAQSAASSGPNRQGDQAWAASTGSGDLHWGCCRSLSREARHCCRRMRAQWTGSRQIEANRLFVTEGRMMNDCSFMAQIYRWLVWGSRNVRTQARETDRGTGEDEKKVKMLRPAEPGPCEAEAASAAGPPSRQRVTAARSDTSATISWKVTL